MLLLFLTGSSIECIDSKRTITWFPLTYSSGARSISSSKNCSQQIRTLEYNESKLVDFVEFNHLRCALQLSRLARFARPNKQDLCSFPCRYQAGMGVICLNLFKDLFWAIYFNFIWQFPITIMRKPRFMNVHSEQIVQACRLLLNSEVRI